ncbi:MAG: thiol peroxidase [Lentisphaeria bacterium]|nr:thiol peroxidase [Lentisphaeria bacterium]
MKNTTLFKGNVVGLAGKFATPGEEAPDFALSKTDLSIFHLVDANGKRLLLNIFPSVDTPVCSRSVRRFNEIASQMENTLVLCVSKDLPFAQSRFCGAEGLKNVVMLSDFMYDSKFGKDYGVLMNDGPLRGLLARAVVIIDSTGRILYAEKSSDIVNEPDYQSALNILTNN